MMRAVEKTPPLWYNGQNATEVKDVPQRAKGQLKIFFSYAESIGKTEAMLKAAQCFDKLGQSARAEALRAQAKAL